MPALKPCAKLTTTIPGLGQHDAESEFNDMKDYLIGAPAQQHKTVAMPAIQVSGGQGGARRQPTVQQAPQAQTDTQGTTFNGAAAPNMDDQTYYTSDSPQSATVTSDERAKTRRVVWRFGR